MRTFIAIELPPAVQEYIAAQQRAVRAALQAAGAAQGLRWTPAEKLHLTLRFLGETTAAQQQAMQLQLAGLAEHHAPFGLAPSALGAFPNMLRPSVIWLGLIGHEVELRALQRNIETAAQNVGFAAETRAFSPHLTLARVDRALPSGPRRHLGAALTELLPATQPASAPRFVVNEFVHMESVLKPAGAEYTVLARFELNETDALSYGQII